MARNPDYTLSWSILDQSVELGRTSIPIADASPVALDITAFESDFLGFLSVGTTTSRNLSVGAKLANASVGTGNREDRWLVRYQDNVTLKTYSFQVPCRDNTLTFIPESDKLDPAQTGYAGMQTALEALATSPDGNAVTLLDVIIIGGR